MLDNIKSHLDTKLWIVILLIGLILCFMGNQVFLKSLVCVRLFSAGPAGVSGGQPNLRAARQDIRPVSGGIVGGILFVSLYQVGLFMLGLLVGGAIGLILSGEMLLPAVLGILTGIAFVVFSGEFIIFGTALIGSYIVCESLFALLLPGMDSRSGDGFCF